jgi:hypothetical protein
VELSHVGLLRHVTDLRRKPDGGYEGRSSGRRGRIAKTGQFVPQRTVRRRPDTPVNETIKKRKRGKSPILRAT